MTWIVIPARPFRDQPDDGDETLANLISEHEYRSVAIRAEEIVAIEFSPPDMSVVILRCGSGYESEIPLDQMLQTVKKADRCHYLAVHKRN